MVKRKTRQTKYVISGYNMFNHKVTCEIYASTASEALEMFHQELEASEAIYERKA